MERERYYDTDYNWCLRNNPQRISKETGRLGNKCTCEGHSDYSTIKIGQNTEEGSGDIRKLPVTKIPMENHQLRNLNLTMPTNGICTTQHLS